MKILIIGNGIAGYSAASNIRHLNKNVQVTLLSKETNPLYSPCVLPQYISGSIARENTFARSLYDYSRLGIKAELGCEVKEIDTKSKRVLRDKGNPLTYDKLILALGSNSRKIDQPKANVFYLKTLADADALATHQGKEAVVVGSGNIGIEIAVALKLRGYRVTILVRSAIMRRSLDAEMGEKIKNTLQRFGIRVLSKEKPVQVLGEVAVKGLRTDKQEIACDTLIWAIGVQPNVKLAEETGIEIGKTGGIKVNAYMETSMPDIYACGDCIETTDLISNQATLNLFWHNANRQGAVAAHNSLGFVKAYAGSENMLNMRIFDAHVVSFGYPESAVKSSTGRNWASGETSVIEHHQEDRYTRLVFCGDRCTGAQFVNPDRQTGLIRSIICRKRSCQSILNACENEEILQHRSWMYPFKALIG